MSYQKLYIKNKSYLSYKNNLISIKIENNETTVCFDDIDTIIIENQQTIITSSLLSQLTKSNINVIFCDEKFMPTSILLGINKNSRTSKIQKAQIFLSKIKLNKLWKDIITNKIKNQSIVLKNLNKQYKYLDNLIIRIKSNDKENIEAIAASYYFKELFGKNFVRNKNEDIYNIVLNYGYTILRSSICRSLIAYGLNPAFGIHHSSELNSFNLADDIIEPFRPIVDNYVARNIKKDTKFNSKIKIDLLKLLDSLVIYKDKNITVNNCIKKIVANYQSVCLNKSENLILFKL
ncbi:type II CRISPR-associated endonuclease Cas1 [Malaciobacter mytili]|uniref:type II CRISPR-associated endonuclease Cas1 n=1 Tax=Malaciobacter mytili TaxID=603050 RepID=UPI003BB1B130